MSTIGIIHPKGTMFLRVACGEAVDDKRGITYELTTNISSNSPIVTSSKTGKIFTLSWQEIIGLAIEAGIDKPTKTKKQKATITTAKS